MFSDSIRNNLSLNDPSISDERIFSVLNKVSMSLGWKIRSMGLSSLVSDGGSNFSLGERQLLSIARALLRDTKIILLDEATASIDIWSEKALQNAIKHEFKDKTVVTVAHRIGTILDCDEVILLKDGIIIEKGEPKKLIDSSSENDNAFKSLYEIK